MKPKYATNIPFDRALKGRIGGNSPKLIENQIPENYVFLGTLIHPRNEKKMLSIFMNSDYEELIEKNIYPEIEVKVFEHDFSEESAHEKSRSFDLNNASISEYTEDEDFENDFFVKVGGEPRLIQEEDYYFENLKIDGYEFLLQIDEEGYGKGVVKGNYPFGYDSLFIYENTKTQKVVAGFWQYS